jgi:hypothetical protein
MLHRRSSGVPAVFLSSFSRDITMVFNHCYRFVPSSLQSGYSGAVKKDGPGALVVTHPNLRICRVRDSRV